MATTEDLFSIINNNDYIKLKKLINQGQIINLINMTRMGISLIYKAIEYRSRECFDILIDINNLTVLKNESSYINGLHIAMKYYNNAQNDSNWYYVEKLLEKGANITVDILKNINDKNIFLKIFCRLNKTKERIDSLLKYLITNGKMEQLEDVYFWLIEEEPEYFNSKTNKNKFLEELFCTAIKTNNLEMIDILRSEKIDLKIVKDNNQITNSLFFALKNSCKTSFEYLINFYKGLSQTEFDNIKDIKELNLLMDKCTNTEILFLLCKLINFKYDIGDQTKFVENIIRKNIILGTRHITRNNIDYNDDYYMLIYLLGKNNFIKQNPLNNFINNVETYEKEYVSCMPHFKSIFTGRIKKLRYLLEFFKFPIPEKFSYIVKATDSATFSKDKLIFINELSIKANVLKLTLEEE